MNPVIKIIVLIVKLIIRYVWNAQMAQESVMDHVSHAIKQSVCNAPKIIQSARNVQTGVF